MSILTFNPYTPLGAERPRKFMYPTRVLVPQLTFVPAAQRRQGNRPPRIPWPVTFDLRGCEGQGVPVRMLASAGAPAARMLANADDLVLLNTGVTKIVFRIMWPGYGHLDWYRPLEIQTPDKPITRAQLGSLIAMNYFRFAERCQKEQCESRRWDLGPGGISVHQLVLVALWNVSDDNWQAEVAYDI